MKNIFNINLFIKNLPNLPGVYRMINNKGEILYIGKASKLKNRVKSYFLKNNISYRISKMVSQIAKIEVTITNSESEALILENNLIKSLMPKYNILYRDDKSYPYIKISSHEFPRISYYRGNLTKPHYYFGPYPNANAVKESISILQKIFKIRTCEDSFFNNRKRPCLLFQIKRCSAPCTNNISYENYNQEVYQAKLFIEGKTDTIFNSINKQMLIASTQLKFEEAAKLRDKLKSLSTIQEQQTINSKNFKNNKNIDIIYALNKNNTICIQWLNIRNGKYIGDKSFFPKIYDINAYNLDTIAQYFLTQHYIGKIKPDIIISNFTIDKTIKEVLIKEKNNLKIEQNPKSKEYKSWLNLAHKNASLSIDQKTSQLENQIICRKSLGKLLNIKNLQKIECFDISHTFGEATIASCVVYDNNSMQNSQYRRFNIFSTSSGNDYIAIKEALIKRYKHINDDDKDNKFKIPDLVIIDGGKGQINVALKVWQQLNLNIPLLGVAKGPERKPGLEHLIIPNSNKDIKLANDDPALRLIQLITNEAHRFAISGHRKKRDKNKIKSKLDEIPGIGSKRKKNLLMRFGSVKKIQSVSIDDLIKVDGINKNLAKTIYSCLHN